MKLISETKVYSFQFDYLEEKNLTARVVKNWNYTYGGGSSVKVTEIIDKDGKIINEERINAYAISLADGSRPFPETNPEYKTYSVNEFLNEACKYFNSYYFDNKSYIFQGKNAETGGYFFSENGEDMDVAVWYIWESPEAFAMDENTEKNSDGGNVEAYGENVTPSKEQIFNQTLYLAELVGYDIEGITFTSKIDELNLDSNLKDNEA